MSFKCLCFAFLALASLAFGGPAHADPLGCPVPPGEPWVDPVPPGLDIITPGIDTSAC